VNPVKTKKDEETTRILGDSFVFILTIQLSMYRVDVTSTESLFGVLEGGAYRDRTDDLRLAKPALSQLS
jgi:hypothetical protein